MNYIKKCALCGDTTEANVKCMWKRDSDQIIFHVCLACREEGVINADIVTMYRENGVSTYTTELPKENRVSASRFRPNVGLYSKKR